MLLTTVAKRFHAFSFYAAIKHLLTLFLMLGCVISQPMPSQAAELSALSPALHASEKFSPIENTEQAILYLNAQNLVDTWNNIIIQAKTGDEQLKLMRESGVFADDIKLTFEFENRQIVMNGLDSPVAHQFYNGFVNGLKKQRYNIASNVEAVEFGKDFLRFNFKHWIFCNERLSVVGENQVLMQREGNHPQIKTADVRVVYFDLDHAY
jgi:hypothetical protein